jgi:hypothetical protein
MNKDDKKEVIVKQKGYLDELKDTHELCDLLMKTPHYQKMGREGIFAIVETAKSLGVDPRLALGGGLYFVKGKVEMSSRMMNALIRSKKHSITRDRKSDDTICILHGKRADNGDMWTESFSITEAQKAGLVKEYGPWQNFRRDMLFARALSRLARQLFPDIVGNTYVEGEISLDPNIKAQNNGFEQNKDIPQIDSPEPEFISEEEYKKLSFFLDQVPDYKEDVDSFLGRKGFKNLWQMPKEMYQKVLENAKKRVEENDKIEGGV